MMKKMIKEFELLELQEQLNKIILKGCKNIRIGDMLHYNIEEKVGIKEAIISIMRIIRSSVGNNYVFEINGSPNTIMFFSNSYRQRTEHFKAFQEVCKTLSDYIKVVPKSYRIQCIPKGLKRIIQWTRQFNSLKIGILQKLYLISVIHQCYCEYEFVQAYCKRNGIIVKNAVCLCDVMPVDSYFVQKWNMLKINTITLQHGTFNIGHYGYTHSISKYFLAHSEFSKNNAVQSGVNESQIYVVGAPQNIRTPIYQFHWKKEKIIGLLLGGTVVEQYDIELVKMVKIFAKKYGYKIYIKFHPGFEKDQYSINIWDGIDKFYESNIDIYDFADLVDFMVDDGSTVFVEYMVQNRIAFTYLCKINPYKEDKNIQLGFETAEEMEKLFLMYQNQNEELLQLLNKNKEYLGTKETPFFLYHKFFCEHLIR